MTSSVNDFKYLHDDDFNLNLEKEKEQEKVESVKDFKFLLDDFTLKSEKEKIESNEYFKSLHEDFPLKLKKEKETEKDTKEKGVMNLWNVNLVTSITDFNEVEMSRKSSNDALKKKQSSIENMDILTFAPYTITAPSQCFNKSTSINLSPTSLSTPNKILSQIKEESESYNVDSQDKLAKNDFMMISKGYN